MNTKVALTWPLLAVAGGVLMTTTENKAWAEELNFDSGWLEEIVVTARRREESLMDTPVSITALTADELESRQIDKVDQIAEATPGLVFQRQAGNNNHTSRIFIRGIGQDDQVPTKQPGVGLYVDGVYVAQNAGSLIDVVDVESIEVLRGPQGTLFGRNTIGGAIQVNTIKPDEEFRGNVELLGGRFDWTRLKAAVNIPFTDNFYGRISLVTQDKKGYVRTPLVPNDDDKGGDNTDAFRIALRWLPTDDVTVDLAADVSEQTSNGPASVLGSPEFYNGLNSQGRPNTLAQYNGPVFTPGGPTAGAAAIRGEPLYTNEWYVGDETYTSLTGSFNRNETDVFGTNLTVQWDVSDSLMVKSISSYRDVDIVATGDFDQSPLNVFEGFDNHSGDAFSQELQLSGSAFDDRMQWVTGLYYYEENLVNKNFVNFPSSGFLSGAEVDNTSQAAFGQFTYEITDRLSLTAGARYTEEDFDSLANEETQYVTSLLCPASFGPLFTANEALCSAAGLDNSVFAPGTVFPPGFPPIPTSNGNPSGEIFLEPNELRIVPLGEVYNASETQFEPYLNLSYDWTDELMTYVSYSEGFKGGGFTQRIVPGGVVESFKPEFAEVYEVGAKWESERVRMTGAFFHNDYTDLQVLSLEAAGGVTRNAANAVIRGGEFELTAAATERLNLSLGLAYLDSEYKNFDSSFTLDLNVNADLPFQAEWQHNASATYALPATFGEVSGELVARLDYSFMGEYFSEAQNLPEHRYGDYELFNAGLTYIPDSDKWEAALAVRNLANKYYKVAGSQTVSENGWNQQIVAPPRTWSVRFKYKF